MPQDRDSIISEDYIIIKFEQPVLASRILIYETFHPGAVVRIWGGRGRGFWSLLWQGAPRKHIGQRLEPFSPELRIIQDLIQ